MLLFFVQLQEALKTWKQFMETLRSKYTSLNFFTTNQLVWLSQDLAKLNQGGNISTETIMNLRLVAPNASDKDLHRFIVDHLRALLHQEDTSVSNESESEEEDNDPLIDLKNSKIFQDSIKHYDENLVLASIITHFKIWNNDKESNDVKEVINDWCDENENDEIAISSSIIENFKNQLKRQRISFIQDAIDGDNMNETQGQRNMADIFDFEDENLDFQNKLEHVWKSFLKLVSLLRNTDYLNFTIIAKVLQELATKYENRLQRAMLKTLSSGKPNLIVVSEKDIHATCLYIYSESDKLLPRPDEVLICTPDTSLEQLELILLRDELTLHQ